MKRGDIEFSFSKKVDCFKWFNNQSVTVLLSNAKEMATISTVL